MATTTWQQAHEKTLRCAAGLQALGLVKGQAVLILGDNRPHLYLGMLAVGMLGGYATPVYPDATPEEIMHVVSSVQVHYVLAEDQEQVDKALDLRERGAPLDHIVYDNPRGLSKYTAPGLVSWQALLDSGAARLQVEAALADALTTLAQPLLRRKLRKRGQAEPVGTRGHVLTIGKQNSADYQRPAVSTG